MKGIGENIEYPLEENSCFFQGTTLMPLPYEISLNESFEEKNEEVALYIYNIVDEIFAKIETYFENNMMDLETCKLTSVTRQTEGKIDLKSKEITFDISNNVNSNTITCVFSYSYDEIIKLNLQINGGIDSNFENLYIEGLLGLSNSNGINFQYIEGVWGQRDDVIGGPSNCTNDGLCKVVSEMNKEMISESKKINIYIRILKNILRKTKYSILGVEKILGKYAGDLMEDDRVKLQELCNMIYVHGVIGNDIIPGGSAGMVRSREIQPLSDEWKDFELSLIYNLISKIYIQAVSAIDLYIITLDGLIIDASKPIEDFSDLTTSTIEKIIGNEGNYQDVSDEFIIDFHKKNRLMIKDAQSCQRIIVQSLISQREFQISKYNSILGSLNNLSSNTSKLDMINMLEEAFKNFDNSNSLVDSVLPMASRIASKVGIYQKIETFSFGLGKEKDENRGVGYDLQRYLMRVGLGIEKDDPLKYNKLYNSFLQSTKD